MPGPRPHFAGLPVVCFACASKSFSRAFLVTAAAFAAAAAAAIALAEAAAVCPSVAHVHLRWRWLATSISE